MSCFVCKPNDPCNTEIICPACVPIVESCCTETMLGSCVFSGRELICSNGTFKVSKGLNYDEVIIQLICKINNLQDQINYIKTQLPATACDVPGITTIN